MKKNPHLKKFLESIITNDLEGFDRMLKQEPDLAFNSAPIVLASLHGKTNLVRKLLKHGTDPDAQTSSHEKYRPLHRAIEHRGIPKSAGHLETVLLLLEAGADPEARSTWMGLTALAVAGMTGDTEMIKTLLQREPFVDLFQAAILADLERVKTILKKSPESALQSDINGMTPLHYAALSGLNKPPEQKRLSTIALNLCKTGADLNTSPKIGPYPTSILHFAAWGRNLAVAKIMLERGANPNLGFPNCLWREPGELGELFVKHGADVNARETSGKPLLNSRVHWNLTSVVRWMLKHGADPNLRDPLGNTALHEAALRGASPNIVAALLTHGARKHLKNKAGKTAADLGRKKKSL